MRTLLPTLAALVLAQASALAQFAPNPVYEYVTARLETQAEQAFAPISNDYVELDSVVIFDANTTAPSGFERTGVAAFVRSGPTLSITQTLAEDDEPTVTRLTAPLSTPANGLLSIPVEINYVDNGTTKSKTLANSAIFANSRLTESSTQLFIRSVIDIVNTTATKYRYDANGRLANQVGELEIGGFRSPEDSATFAYDTDGRLAASVNYSYQTDDNGVAGYVRDLDLRYTYLGPGNVRAYIIDDAGDTASYFAYRFRGSVLDSFYAIDRNFSSPVLGFWRTDGLSTDDIRQYDYFSLDFTTATTVVRARSVQYFNGATSSVSRLPQLRGQIVSANPIRAGGLLRYEGPADQAVEWRVHDLHGRTVSAVSQQRELTVPSLASGIYFALVTAPGYAALTKMLVVE